MNLSGLWVVFSTKRRRTTLGNYIIVEAWAKLQQLCIPATIKRLQSQELSNKPITDPESTTYVSLTTYGPRVDRVHLAIESIARGTSRPGRIVLWLDDVDIDNPPVKLKQLQQRGLELRQTINYGPHKKAYPALRETVPEDWVFVTADDDVFYPSWWLDRIEAAVKLEPDVIVCLRALAYRLTDKSSLLAPMKEWRWVNETKPSCAHFAIGVSGIAYPPRLRKALVDRGTAFLAAAPKADDVWINAVAAELNIGIKQASKRRKIFPSIPGTKDTALMHTNVTGGQNDVQIRQTYSATAIANIRKGLKTCVCR